MKNGYSPRNCGAIPNIRSAFDIDSCRLFGKGNGMCDSIRVSTFKSFGIKFFLFDTESLTCNKLRKI